MTREEAYKQGLTECDRYYINLIERLRKEKKLEEYESLGDIKELIHIDRVLEIIDKTDAKSDNTSAFDFGITHACSEIRDGVLALKGEQV